VAQRQAPGIAPAMRAIRLHAPGDPGRLVAERLPTPRPGAGEALVRVHAAAITRDELDWPADRLPAIPSYELSGVVAALGPDADGVTVGAAVYALSPFDRDGAAADYTLVPAALLAPKPRTLDHLASATVPLAGLSAWQGLFDHGGLAAGQRVLIHGAAGGVGSLAVQLARWRGAQVVATTSAGNAQTARALGADEVVEPPWARLEDTAGQVDLVFDTAGGERLAASPALLRPGGRLVSVAEEPPSQATEGRGITARYFVVEPNREQLVELARLVDGGELRPLVGEVFPLADAAEAFRRSLGGHRPGKLVLRVADDPT
jgi:NADPH:quinone reductase-like Zn-dependent oxidoreductase